MNIYEKDAATVLEEAADLLLIHGRCTGTAQRKDESLCVLGALTSAMGNVPKDICIETYNAPARVALERHLAATGAQAPAADPDRGSAWIWNDTTEDDFEVIDTLRRVAKDLRNAGQP